MHDCPPDKSLSLRRLYVSMPKREDSCCRPAPPPTVEVGPCCSVIPRARRTRQCVRAGMLTSDEALTPCNRLVSVGKAAIDDQPRRRATDVIGLAVGLAEGGRNIEPDREGIVGYDV